jgi:two-component sensor histidine kinase
MDVIEGAISVHRASSARIHLNGPRMDVGAKAALGLTMALHELCTNAAKYGALSNDSGTVSIDWSVAGGAADARFRLTWTERGGPPVKPPSQKGFGSRLVGDSVAADVKGEATLTFEPSGVVWSLQAPLTAVKESF